MLLMFEKNIESTTIVAIADEEVTMIESDCSNSKSSLSCLPKELSL
jgi:hypothetical protein